MVQSSLAQRLNYRSWRLAKIEVVDEDSESLHLHYTLVSREWKAESPPPFTLIAQGTRFHRYRVIATVTLSFRKY